MINSTMVSFMNSTEINPSLLGCNSIVTHAGLFCVSQDGLFSVSLFSNFNDYAVLLYL